MIVTLKNPQLTVQVSTRGAELQAITAADGTEFLWDGDARYWGSRATNLFPFVGRLHGQQYTLHSETYPLGIHGFFRHMETLPRERDDTRVNLECGATDETLAQYPFPFRAGIDYRLDGNTLFITHRVHNTGEKTMVFGLGGHPGFRVPLEDGLQFEDYAVRFSQPVTRLLTSENCLMTGEEAPYPLDDNTLPLRHELFDQDAIILKNPGREVALLAPGGQRGIVLRHPEMDYLGLWHRPQSTAPYVCLEPWLSLPGREGVTEDLARFPDLVHLEPGRQYENTWSIEVRT